MPDQREWVCKQEAYHVPLTEVKHVMSGTHLVGTFDIAGWTLDFDVVPGSSVLLIKVTPTVKLETN